MATATVSYSSFSARSSNLPCSIVSLPSRFKSVPSSTRSRQSNCIVKNSRFESAPVMHRVLCIPELVGQIVDMTAAELEHYHIGLQWFKTMGHEEPTPGPDRLRDLESLGLTARIWREPTLDAIWHTQYSLAPLLRSVGAVHNECDEEELRDDPIGFLNPTHNKVRRILSPEDVPTLLFYSSRIRALYLPRLLPTDLSQDQIAALPKNQPLFPQLRTLLSRTGNTAETAMVLQATGDMLTDLGASPRSLSPVVHLLNVVSSKLRSLWLIGSHVTKGPDKDLFRAGVCSALPSAANMTELYLAVVIDDDLWQSISQLSRLNSLNLHHPYRDPAASPLFLGTTGKTIAFPSLTAFEVQNWSTSSTTTVLQTSSFPSLRRLALHLHDALALHPPDAIALMAAITDACSSKTLERLSVSLGDFTGGRHEMEGGFISPTFFRPLIPFTQMRYLYLWTSWAWDLDDTLIRDIARAWPNITYLYLSARGKWPKPSRITLQGLEPLAKYCPLLQYFGAQIDSEPPDLAHDAAHGRGQWLTGLRTLDVGSSCIGVLDSETVASCLSRMFPHLQKIMYSLPPDLSEDEEENFEYDDSDWARWDCVTKLLPVLGSARVAEEAANLATRSGETDCSESLECSLQRSCAA